MPYPLTVYSQLFYPELRSTGQSLTELCEALTKLGAQITVYCAPPSLYKPGKTPRKLVHNTIIVTRLFSTKFPKSSLTGKLINHITFSLSVYLHVLCNKQNSPILVPTNPPFFGLIFGILASLKRLKYVYVVYDVYPDTGIKLGVLNTSSWVVRVCVI